MAILDQLTKTAAAIALGATTVIPIAAAQPAGIKIDRDQRIQRDARSDRGDRGRNNTRDTRSDHQNRDRGDRSRDRSRDHNRDRSRDHSRDRGQTRHAHRDDHYRDHRSRAHNQRERRYNNYRHVSPRSYNYRHVSPRRYSHHRHASRRYYNPRRYRYFSHLGYSRPLVLSHRYRHYTPRYRIGVNYSYYPQTILIADYGYYGLYDPPYGYHWVRDHDNGDAILASVATGAIIGLVVGALAGY